MKWNGIPTYEELWKTLNLGYKFLKNGKNDKLAKSKAVTSLKFVNQSLRETISDQIEYFKKKNKKETRIL